MCRSVAGSARPAISSLPSTTSPSRTLCHTCTGDSTSTERGPTSRVGRLAPAMRLDPFETWTDAERRRAQWQRLSAKLPELRQKNPFYRARLSDRAGRLDELPFTTKAELSEDQAAHPPFGTTPTYPIHRYVRLHRTKCST